MQLRGAFIVQFTIAVFLLKEIGGRRPWDIPAAIFDINTIASQANWPL
ncbi:hypothetical protein DCCM_2501 [Desulfocucumis palustris]|uniref:Uncharacterized protein n=1 Tax=Desulfocucumis palustris TaxID=1898651 RepID=A0A2L2XBC0_9FIRM|nr:hypothetical protein DCCM_2501 [Desulfocucumis palustris]